MTVLGVFLSSIACKQDTRVRIENYIVMNWNHVLVIVQCQSDGCRLSCKYVAVV